MKTTGIIRRVDDLGRVVIPKEIRRNLNIRDGEPLEIYVGKIDGIPCVSFAKYSIKFLDELNAVRDKIEGKMTDCGEYELSIKFKHAMEEAAKVLNEFEKRG